MRVFLKSDEARVLVVTSEVEDPHKLAGDLSLGGLDGDKLVHGCGVGDVALKDCGAGGESASDDFTEVEVGQFELNRVSLCVPGHACNSHIAVVRYLWGWGHSCNGPALDFNTKF